MKRLTIVTVFIVTLVAGPAGAAFAHECFVADRSAQGTESSANGMWVYITTDDIIGFINVRQVLVWRSPMN